jgi:hypothetical protein
VRGALRVHPQAMALRAFQHEVIAEGQLARRWRSTT